MKLKLLQSGTVFAGGDPACRSALYPGVCALPSGRWIVTFRAAPERYAMSGQRALMCVSDDCGKTWAARDLFTVPPTIDGRRGEYMSMYVTPLGGDELLGALMWIDVSVPGRTYYNPETQGIVDHRIFLTRSHDGGESWSLPRELSGIPHTHPTALTAPILLMPDGRLCCQFEMHKHHGDTGPVFFQGAVVFSGDGGDSWSDMAIVSHDPNGRYFFWDQRINTVDGGLLGLFWSYDDAQSKYLNIHAAKSDEAGGIWGTQYDTGVPGQPSQPVRLPDGSLAMAYVDRTAAPEIKARRSTDGGVTWPDDSELVIFDSGQKKQDNDKSSLSDMWAEMYRFSTGFPVAAALPDGMLVCYYAGNDTDSTAIRWARVGI